MTLTRGIRAEPVGEASTRVLDVSCGSCTACSKRRSYWCLEPGGDGRAVATVPASADPEGLWRWFSVLQALAECTLRDDEVVLVLSAASRDAVTSLVGLVHRGLVCVSEDGREDPTRAILARASATGRAHLVVASHDARRAVKAVQRGGTVCLPDAPVLAPTITELVQRDVRLVGPHGTTELRDRVDDEALGRALAAVLAPGTLPSSAV